MVHRVRVHIVETVEYTSPVDRTVKHIDRTLRLLLYELKGKTELKMPDGDEDAANNKPSTSLSSVTGLHFPSLHKTLSGKSQKKPREKLTGNLLHYLTPSSNSTENYENIEDASTTIDCTLPFVAQLSEVRHRSKLYRNWFEL